MFEKISIYEEKHKPHVFFDVGTGVRVVIEILNEFGENLRNLCANNHYQGCTFDKMLKEGFLRTGVVEDPQECHRSNLTHSQAGMVSVANPSSSLVLVTLREAPELDDQFVVVGKVISGMNKLLALANAETDTDDDVKIIGCGQLD